MQTVYTKQAHVLMYMQRFCVLCKHGIPAAAQLVITPNVNGESCRITRHYSQVTDSHVRAAKNDKLDDFVHNLRTTKTYQKRNKWKHIARETKHLNVNNYMKKEKVQANDLSNNYNKGVSHQKILCNDQKIAMQDSSHSSGERDNSRISNQSSVEIAGSGEKKGRKKEEQVFDIAMDVKEHELPKQASLELQGGVKNLYIQVPQNKIKKISNAEESFLIEMINLKETRKAFTVVEEYGRKEQYPSFPILRQLCAWASIDGNIDDVKRIKDMARSGYPRQYKYHLYFDTYFASALYCEGKLKESLNVLHKLFVNNPKRIKKTKDTAAFILSKVMETGDENQEKLALSFVTTLAKEHSQHGPALALWRAGFCSARHRHHVMVDDLLEQHPDLIEQIPRKLTSVIDQASSSGNKELLHRTLQFLLHHQISECYAPATSALLQHQCELGDLSGADETIRFAQTMKVQLKPDELQRFLNLLNYHKRPAPLTVLRLKYGRAPPEPLPVPKAPKFQYKF